MPRRHHMLITSFVIGWTILFHYETLRANYLTPLVGRELPKFPLLFPPAGWIMFFNIEPTYGFAEVYALEGRQPTKLDPHDIFATWALGYDNIHRNVLIGVLSRDAAPSFCRYLTRKFAPTTAFAVVYSLYPDVITQPDQTLSQVAYTCP